jgi:hypothetical protein
MTQSENRIRIAIGTSAFATRIRMFPACITPVGIERHPIGADYTLGNLPEHLTPKREAFGDKGDSSARVPSESSPALLNSETLFTGDLIVAASSIIATKYCHGRNSAAPASLPRSRRLHQTGLATGAVAPRRPSSCRAGLQREGDHGGARHKSFSMVQVCAARAQGKRLATSAIAKLKGLERAGTRKYQTSPDDPL